MTVGTWILIGYSAFLIGLIPVGFITWLYTSRWKYRGKVQCLFHLPGREALTTLLKPKDSFVTYQKGKYKIEAGREELIHKSMVTIPQYQFVLNRPRSVSVLEKGVDSNGLTAKEISQDFDNVVRAAKAMSNVGGFDWERFQKLILVLIVVVVIGVGASTWYLGNKISDLEKSLLGTVIETGVPTRK